VSQPLPSSIPAGHVLLRLAFAGVNASDVNFSSGRYHPSVEQAQASLPFDAGFEAVGAVAAVGPQVSGTPHAPLPESCLLPDGNMRCRLKFHVRHHCCVECVSLLAVAAVGALVPICRLSCVRHALHSLLGALQICSKMRYQTLGLGFHLTL